MARAIMLKSENIVSGYAYGGGNHIDINFGNKIPKQLIVYCDNIAQSSLSAGKLISFFAWDIDDNGKINLVAFGNKWNGSWNIVETTATYKITVDDTGATIDVNDSVAGFSTIKPYHYIAIY